MISRFQIIGQPGVYVAEVDVLLAQVFEIQAQEDL